MAGMEAIPAARASIFPLTHAYWPEVAAIYRAGIATGHATFETEPPAWEEFDRTRLREHRRVALAADGSVLGWVAAAKVSDRCVYAGVVEHSVYVHPEAQGHGIGRSLLDALAKSTEEAGIWTIQSGIFPENTASLAMHQAAGYRVIGTRSSVGLMTYGPCQNRWRDVVLVERRSPIVGV